MQAVILAGGLATRMRPLTEKLPKSLLPVAGKPFLSWQLEAIKRSGFTRVLLLTGHLAEPLRAFAADGSAFGLQIRYCDDGPTLLGTAGALRQAQSELEDTFLVTYGDSYLPFDYGAPLADLLAHPEAEGTLAVYENHGRWEPSNTLVVGELVARYEKRATDPLLTYIDYGAMALRKSVVASLPAGQVLGLDQLQSDLCRRATLRAYRAQQRFYEIGSPAGLAELEQYLALQS